MLCTQTQGVAMLRSSADRLGLSSANQRLGRTDHRRETTSGRSPTTGRHLDLSSLDDSQRRSSDVAAVAIKCNVAYVSQIKTGTVSLLRHLVTEAARPI